MSLINRNRRPAVAVDVVAFSIRDRALSVWMVKRGRSPFRGMWSVPGGFVDMSESLEKAAERTLRDAGVEHGYLEQLYTFGAPERDPRTRVVTVAYIALVRQATATDRGSGSAAAWFPVYRLAALAFDHAAIVRHAVERLRNKLSYTTMGLRFLPGTFTLTELQDVYEIVFHRRLDKRNFRKKVLSTRLLESQSQTRSEGAHRPARLYRLKRNAPFFLDIKLV